MLRKVYGKTTLPEQHSTYRITVLFWLVACEKLGGYFWCTSNTVKAEARPQSSFSFLKQDMNLRLQKWNWCVHVSFWGGSCRCFLEKCLFHGSTASNTNDKFKVKALKYVIAGHSPFTADSSSSLSQTERTFFFKEKNPNPYSDNKFILSQSLLQISRVYLLL